MSESSVVEVQRPQGQPSVERVPGEPDTLGDAWREFKDRVQVGGNERAEDRHTPEKRGQSKDDGEGTEQKEETERATGKDDAKPATAEGEGESKQAPKPERQQTPQQVALDRILERASKEPDFDKVVERLEEPLFPLSREGAGRYAVLGQALQECINADEIVYFLARPENSSIVHKMQDAAPYQIAKTVHMISAELRFGKRTTKAEEEPRRRPKPAVEVGGRGTAPDDAAKAAARAGDFAGFEKEMNRRTRADQR